MLGFLNRDPSRCPSSAPLADNACFHPSPGVKASIHADGVVLVNHAKGVLFSSNLVGARIWRGAAEHWDLGRLTASISEEFHVARETAKADAAAFLAQLEAAGLMVRDAN